MTVLRDYNPYPTKETQQASAGLFPIDLSQKVESGNQLLQGATLRTSTAFGRAATVKPGEDIRPALESLRSAGGGTLILLAGLHQPTYDIVGFDGLKIIGEGRDITIIDFALGNYNINFVGTTSNFVSNFVIRDITIKNSSDAVAGLNIELAEYFEIRNLYINTCSQVGLRIARASDWLCADCNISASGAGGFLIASGDDHDTGRFTVSNVYSNANTNYDFKLQNTGTRSLFDFNFINARSEGGTYGFYFDLGTTDMLRFSFVGCSSISTSNDGFFANAGVGCEMSGAFTACIADAHTRHGFNFSASSYSDIKFIGCTSTNNGQSGYVSDAGGAIYIGCYSDDNSGAPGTNVGADWAISHDTVLVGNVADSSWDDGINVTGYAGGLRLVAVGNIQNNQSSNNLLKVDANTNAFTSANGQFTPANAEYIITMFDNAVGITYAGDVVIYDTDASGNGYNHTTVAGDDRVVGVKVDGNGGYDYIQTLGKVTNLKVNGTTDIAVGDFLSTYSVAGIAAKASDGHTAFAIALEAYTGNDSNGVIDALLISPRKIGSGGSTPDTTLTKNVITANTTITAGYSAYIPMYAEVADTFTLDVGDGSYLEIG